MSAIQNPTAPAVMTFLCYSPAESRATPGLNDKASPELDLISFSPFNSAGTRALVPQTPQAFRLRRSFRRQLVQLTNNFFISNCCRRTSGKPPQRDRQRRDRPRFFRSERWPRGGDKHRRFEANSSQNAALFRLFRLFS